MSSTNQLKKLYLIGGGGHCVSSIDVILQTGEYSIEGIFDLKENIGKQVLGYPIVDEDKNLSKYVKPEHYFLITLGQIKSSTLRKNLFLQLKELNANIATIISPLAYVSPSASVGEGTLVCHQALINAEGRVGVNGIINTKSLIEHSSIIGDHCHLSTACVVNGDCHIGNDVFIGSNAVLEHGANVKDGTVLSAGKFHRSKEM